MRFSLPVSLFFFLSFLSFLSPRARFTRIALRRSPSCVPLFYFFSFSFSLVCMLHTLGILDDTLRRLRFVPLLARFRFVSLRFTRRTKHYDYD